MRRSALHLILAVVTVTGLTACERGAFAPPTLEPLEITFGREWVRDRKGRVVILRGATYTITETSTEFGTFREAGELALIDMAGLGMNLIRLPLSWAELEPKAGRRTTHYLRMRVDPIVRLAAAHGMAIVLTMRGWPRGPCDGSDEAIPAWVCDSVDKAPDPACGFWRAEGPRRIPLRTHYANTWSMVAGHYSQDMRVVAFDVLDEPSSGGCFDATAFEAGHLLPFYDQAARKIRGSAATQAMFLEPPAGRLSMRPLGERPTPELELAFAPHIWTQRRGPPREAAGNALGDAYRDASAGARRVGAPLLVGAIGGDLPPEPGSLLRRTSPAFLLQSLDELDRHRIGGAFYALRPRGKKDPSFELGRTLQAVLMRPYARRIAGVPTKMSFDPRALEFELRFEDDPEHAPPDPTEIYLPVQLYGPTPEVEVSGGGTYRLDTRTQRLLVYRGSGAEHEVRVRPATGVD